MNRLDTEIYFKTSRSQGSGGQNVNKVESRVELYFNVTTSALLSETEKQLIMSRLSTRINNIGVLRLTASKDRSQLMNKRAVIEKFYNLIEDALTIDPERKSTKPTYSSKIRILKTKKAIGVIKKLRSKVNIAHND